MWSEYKVNECGNNRNDILSIDKNDKENKTAELDIAFSLINTKNADERTNGLYTIDKMINEKYVLEMLCVSHINSLIPFLCSGNENEQNLALTIMTKIFSIEEDKLTSIASPDYIFTIISIIENTNNDSVCLNALKCIFSFIKEKKDLPLQIGKKALLNQFINGLTSTELRFASSAFIEDIVETSFNIGITIFNLFGENLNEEDEEEISTIVSFCNNFLSKYPQYILKFLLSFCNNCYDMFHNYVYSEGFLSNVYELCYVISETVDDLIFRISDSILLNEPDSCMFILSSNLIGSYDVTKDYENSTLMIIMKTFHNLINCFVNGYLKAPEKSEELEENISTYFPVIVESAANLMQNSVYELKVESCLLICEMMRITYSISLIIVDNFDGVIPCLTEMLQGKDKKLDMSIIRCIMQIVATGDKKAMCSQMEGDDCYNIFLDDVCSSSFTDAIDSIKDIYEDDEDMDKLISELFNTIDIYKNFAMFD